MSEIKTIIGLCGGSGSGKSRIVDQIKFELPNHEVAVLTMDDYYKPIEKQEKDENGMVNFDLPTAIEIENLLEDLNKLKNGESLEFQEYTFNNPNAKPKVKIVKPAEILIVEGIFLLHFQELVDQLDTSVYIDVEANLQLKRRLDRDMKIRGYTKDEILYQWEHHVIPCFDQYIQPNISKADIIIHNNEEGKFNTELVINHLKASLV